MKLIIVTAEEKHERLETLTGNPEQLIQEIIRAQGLFLTHSKFSASNITKEKFWLPYHAIKSIIVEP